MDQFEVYSPIRPIHVEDVGRCYYCGCEAESRFDDYVPPKRFSAFYIENAEPASLAIVPACKECHGFLLVSREALIGERKQIVNKKIGRKYSKALNIFERWNEEELAEMSVGFVTSIRAGLELGEEAYCRLVYSGYEYEIEGTIYHERRRNVKKYFVFGKEFDNFRNALQYAARSYQVNINVLKNWLVDNGANFDRAIQEYWDFEEKERIRKLKERLCSEFAKTHKQNPNFVKGALDAYEEANPGLSLEQCLVLLYEERIKK